MNPRSRQEAKVRSSLSEQIQWDGQYSSLRSHKLAIKGHLLHVGAGYLVNPVFHASYLKYVEHKEGYLDSENFRVNYPDMSLRQARLDWTEHTYMEF